MTIKHSKVANPPSSRVDGDDWNAVHIEDCTELDDVTDLDTIVTTGLYSQSDNAEATIALHYPVTEAGLLEVFSPNANFVYQRYIRYGTPYTTYVRIYNVEWSDWTVSWNNLNDGSASGLDADKLDGQEGSYYLPANSYIASDILTKLLTVDGTGSGLDADKLDGEEGSFYLPAGTYTAEDILTKLKTVDGTGTGLDADLLDSQHASYFLPASSYTASDILTKLKTVDGPGSGLDADLLDGAHAVTVATASSIPKTNSAGTLDPSFLASKTYQPIATINIPEGSPVTSQSLATGLNGNVDKYYYLEYALHNSNAIDYFYLNPNGITTNGTGLFDWSGVWGSPAALTGPMTDSIGRFCLCKPNGRGLHKGIALLNAIANATEGGRELNEWGFSRDANSGGGYIKRSTTSFWEQTSTNITSLTLTASAAFWGVIRLYKLI